MQQIYSTGEVSRIVGVQPYKIAYAILTGQLPEPAFRFLNNRCFTPADLRRVAQYFGVAAVRPVTELTDEPEQPDMDE